jgi:pSer/pThr/pTyr-binding forkhead associated (FHA) protein
LARYRLRFVLQEFDLPRGATIIGRSLECHLTIDDPLVSRQHARITVGDDGAQIEDVGSRNGVRVNGAKN